MTKWFNTNYHYMVPEFVKGQQFKLTWTQLLDEVDEALALGHKVKPVLLGPVTWLWLCGVLGWMLLNVLRRMTLKSLPLRLAVSRLLRQPWSTLSQLSAVCRRSASPRTAPS